MGQFGGQPYFEGPIETKSMIMTPSAPLLSASSSSSTKKKTPDEKEIKGLEGETINLITQRNNLKLEENQLKREMYDGMVESNNKGFDNETMNAYSKRLMDLNQKRTILDAQIANAEKRRDVGYKTIADLGGNKGTPLADDAGNFITVGNLKGPDGKLDPFYESLFYGRSDDDPISGNDLVSIINNSPRVNGRFLNYKSPDSEKYLQTTRNLFKGLGSFGYGAEDRINIMLALRDNSVEDVIKKFGKDKFVSGSDNAIQLAQALQDYQSSSIDDPEFSRARNYAFSRYKYINSDKFKDLSDEEINRRYLTNIVGPKLEKQRNRTENANVGGLGNGSGNTKEYVPFRSQAYNETARKNYITASYTKDVEQRSMGDEEGKDFRNLLIGNNMTPEAYANKYGYSQPGMEDMQKRYQNDIMQLDKQGYRGEQLNTAIRKLAKKYANEAMLLKPNTATDYSEMLDRRKVLVKNRQANINNIFTSSNVYSIPQVAYGKIGGDNSNLFITKNADEFLFGYKNLYEKKRQIGYLNVPIQFSDEFGSLSKGQTVDPYMEISIGGGSDFKSANQYLGLENAQFVHVDAYLYNVDDEGNNAMKTYIKIPAEDFEEYMKNTIDWKELDDEELVDVQKTLGDLYAAGAMDVKAIKNLNDNKNAAVLTDNIYRNSEGFIMTENHVYVPVLVKDNKGMYETDMKIIQKDNMSYKITEAKNTESNVPSKSNFENGEENVE